MELREAVPSCDTNNLAAERLAFKHKTALPSQGSGPEGPSPALEVAVGVPGQERSSAQLSFQTSARTFEWFHHLFFLVDF